MCLHPFSRVVGVAIALMLAVVTPVSAQGVLAALGEFDPDGVSLDDAAIPLPQRVAQARALGHLGDERAAVSILTKALARRPTLSLRDAIVMSLAERRSRQAVPELLRSLRARVGTTPLIYTALAAIGGAEVTEALTELVTQPDRVQRELALNALSRVSPAHAAPILIAGLAGPDVAWHWAAFRVAVAQPNALWVDGLATALATALAPDAKGASADASATVWALSRATDGSGLSALLKAAANVPANAELFAAIAACVRAYRDVIPAPERERALASLNAAPSASRAALLVLASATDVLADGETHDVVADKATRVELRRTLRERGPEVVGARVDAALKLARLDDAKTHIALIAALADPDVVVRRAVVRALSLVDRDEARAALLRHAALEPDAEVAALAVVGANRLALAFDDPWGRARKLL